ncbi:cytochrome c oxidase subunit II [Halomonas cerina]|uniref:cytochrome-c oxidase n=1 Tax=Halomonas cerina TaxID=447424 RepID=A0A839V3F5_9GAMM|nr:cytochrome c oxidase subunit II [Halomonas cerina]MBB3189671.1 cytochrome c oxidase subunit 2 [Halomonas cerina]
MNDEVADYLPAVEKGLHLIPTQASSHAGQVDQLYYVLIAACAIILLVVVGMITWFGFRYRAGNEKADRSSRPSTRTENRVEIAVLAAMLGVFMVLFAWATTLYLNVYRGPEPAMTIDVVGKQWMWKVQHPDGTREINSLHVPADEVIQLRVTSQDVIHSFFVPAFRLKRDVVPGTEKMAWFEATEPGNYRLFCAEYCGSFHSRMLGKVVVMEKGDYQAWLTRQRSGGRLAAIGQQLFAAHGCSGCHKAQSGVRAPSLAGLYGRRVALEDGRVVMADDAYIRDSILQPKKQVVAGFEPLMPSFAGQLDEGDILPLIEYIKSLQPSGRNKEPVPMSQGVRP